jgi:hypothetical protein
MRKKVEEGVYKETKIDFEHRAEGKNKKQAIRSLTVPVLRYSFGIINWHQEEIKKLNKIKKNANSPWTASPKSRH